MHTWHCTLDTSHSTLFTLYSALWALDTSVCTSYILHSLHLTAHLTLHRWHSILYTPHSTFDSPHLTLYTPHSTCNTWHTRLHTSHCTPHTARSTLYILHFALYTLHSTLHTWHVTLYTLHSSNKASPQRARPSHALLHITLYTYTKRPGTPIRTMNFLLPFPFPLIFSSSSIAFLMFWLRSCFILPSIPVAPQMHVDGRTRGESKPTVTQLPHGTSASKSTAMATRIRWGKPQNGPFWGTAPRTPYSHFVRNEQLQPSLTAGFRNISMCVDTSLHMSLILIFWGIDGFWLGHYI